MRLFKRQVTLEKQLEELAEIGLTLNPDVREEDLFAFADRKVLESKPYQGLIEVMGIEVEREPFTPVSNRIWMCDYERIEDHGAYRDVLDRLELMTGNTLGLTNIADFVDVEQGVAWVEFDLSGERIRWEFSVEDDWLDPTVLLNYDRLLKEAGSPLRIYSNHADYGQVALLIAFTQEDKRRFDKLSKVKLALIEKAA